MQRALVIGASLALAVAGCQRAKDKDKKDKGKSDKSIASVKKPGQQKIPPPPDVKAPPASAKKHEGISYVVLEQGTGTEVPGGNDTVKVHYTGWKATSGDMYHSTTLRKRPMTIPLPQVPPGWAAMLTQMKVGEKRRVWMTAEQAFKAHSRMPKENMTYELELVEIKKAPPVPEDLAHPDPKKTKKTKSGLTYRVLKKGEGKEKPKPWDDVKIHYSAWTIDGKMVDSSVMRGRPVTLKPSSQSEGWKEGLQLMVQGEKTRFWIPEELAKPPRGPQRHKGLTVFDIELLEVTKRPEPPPVPKDVKAPPKTARKTKKGVYYRILKRGKGGKKPDAWDKVKVHYTGWTTDGKMFDSSVVRGKPIEFSLSGVIPGWTDGLQVMRVGDKARLWIPPELAYKGRRGPQGMLVFDVQLLAVTDQPKPPDPPKTPADVAAPPKNAKKTAKGVFYKVLKPGTGKVKPTASDTVVVHYTGWTTDGKMFDSSIRRGKPATFPLRGVIPGWTDGLQVMVVGEKTRFWIPVELAYKNMPGRPKGMLVFDVELLEIKKSAGLPMGPPRRPKR